LGILWQHRLLNEFSNGIIRAAQSIRPQSRRLGEEKKEEEDDDSEGWCRPRVM
jgi:hypothetical protein